MKMVNLSCLQKIWESSISIISIGFEKYESDFSLTLNKSIDFGTINLNQESFELNDVDVTARRKIQYKGKLIEQLLI